MSKHSFDKDIRARAKTDDRSLIAYAYRGKTFDFDMEGPRDHDFALKLTNFMIHVTAKQDINLIPSLPSEIKKTKKAR